MNVKRKKKFSQIDIFLSKLRDSITFHVKWEATLTERTELVLRHLGFLGMKLFNALEAILGQINNWNSRKSPVSLLKITISEI